MRLPITNNMLTHFIINGLQADRVAIALKGQNQTDLTLKGLAGGTGWQGGAVDNMGLMDRGLRPCALTAGA